MSYILDKVSIDTFYGTNLMNLLKILERNPRITNITLERNEPCLAGEIVVWEQNNDVKMPRDLRVFYLAHNGFKIGWSYRFGSETLPVGSIHISNLKDLAPITCLPAIEPCGLIQTETKFILHLGYESKAFRLSEIDNESSVCLVYVHKDEEPNIWLMDEYLKCHYLSHGFKNYMRMAILHLGLPYWQFCFTNQGVPPWVEQIIRMDYPHIVNHRPYDIQQRREMKTNEGKKKKNKHNTNVINKDIFALPSMTRIYDRYKKNKK